MSSELQEVPAAPNESDRALKITLSTNGRSVNVPVLILGEPQFPHWKVSIVVQKVKSPLFKKTKTVKLHVVQVENGQIYSEALRSYTTPECFMSPPEPGRRRGDRLKPSLPACFPSSSE